MGNFLENLAIRNLQPAASEATRLLQPRLPSLFESSSGMEASVAAPYTDRQVEAKPEVQESASEQEVLPTSEKIKSSPIHIEPQRTILEHIEAEPTVSVQSNVKESRQPERGEKRSMSQTKGNSIYEVKTQASLLPEEHKSRKAIESQLIEQTALPRVEAAKTKSESKPSLEPLPISTIGRHQDLMLEPTAEREPVVHIRIGRIEVRAVTAPQQPAARLASQKPHLTLDEYLRQRDEGKR
jgi:hypothetical protein